MLGREAPDDVKKSGRECCRDRGLGCDGEAGRSGDDGLVQARVGGMRRRLLMKGRRGGLMTRRWMLERSEKVVEMLFFLVKIN